MSFWGDSKKWAILALCGLTVTEIVWQIYRSRWSRRKRDPAIREVILFSDQLALCRVHANSRIACERTDCTLKNLRRIGSRIDAASETLDVCMYLFTCEDLANAVLRAASRNVVVRVIVDGTMSENSACDRLMRHLQSRSIRVRSRKSPHLMHHKFVVVDKTLVITGSTNWTMQAFYGNWDNVLILNDGVIVDSFAKEFDRMWAEYRENNCTDPRFVPPL